MLWVLKNFLFYVGVELVNNVVIVSGGQQKDSVIHTHVSFLPQTTLPASFPRNIEQSSLRYIVGPCWLHILDITVCTCRSQIPYRFPPLILSSWLCLRQSWDYKLKLGIKWCEELFTLLQDHVPWLSLKNLKMIQSTYGRSDIKTGICFKML